MPKPNYAFAKRQKDLAKKQKKEAKRLKKAESNQPVAGTDAGDPAAPATPDAPGGVET